MYRVCRLLLEKTAKGTEEAADKAPQQHAQQNEKACDILFDYIGGVNVVDEIRMEHARTIREMDLDGYAVFFQAEDGIRDTSVTGVQTCALPI